MTAYQAGAARVSSTVTKRNPRPRKYASASERQAAYRARAPEVCFRAEAKTVETLDQIAETLDQPRADVLLSMTKFALANHDWARFGLTHKPLPYGYGLAKQEFVGPRMDNPSAYSDPALWEHSKQMARDQLGGHSARAMQLAGKIYRAAGGKYLGKRTKAQKSLEQWTAQDWTTKSGKPSRQTGERYLPRKVIEELTPAEYGATTRAKRAGSAAGQQFVKQPKRIAAKVAALKGNPTMKKPTPAQLAARAKFAEMARSGAFKRKAKRKANPASKFAKGDEVKFAPAVVKRMENDARIKNMRGTIIQIMSGGKVALVDTHGTFVSEEGSSVRGIPTANLVHDIKRNPTRRKKTVSQKISQLTREGYPQKQAIAIALEEQRKGKVKRNPRASNPAKFTASQIASLRDHYSMIEAIDPSSDSYIKLTAKLDAMSLPVLKQLADARIKWISALARNRVSRMERKTNPATGTKKSRTKLNPAVEVRDLAKDVPQARVQYAVHMPGRPSYHAMAYFTKEADALAAAKEVADRTGKIIAVSRVQVHFGPM